MIEPSWSMAPLRCMTRMRRSCGALIILLGGLAAATAFADPRILEVRPLDRGWRVNLAGVESPTFAIDGAPVEAQAVRDASGAVAWELASGTAADRWLVVHDAAGETLAVRLGPDEPREAPFSDWNVYHIMLAYFRNGDVGNDRAGLRRWVHRNYAGGDLQGVASRAEYLAGLGVNAVWLSPLFASETSHGYDVLNYYRVGDAVSVPRDPAAAMKVYQQTVDALHAAGIRVILDLPLDYAAGAYERRTGDPKRLRPKTTSAKQEAERLWESWNTGFRYWNFEDPGTREFLKDVGRYWLTEGHADGFRLDYVRGVPHDFWAEFYAEMKRTKPGAFLFGEGWQDAAAALPNALDIAGYYRPVEGVGPQFDGLLEYPLQLIMTEVFGRGAGEAADLERWLQFTAGLYGPTGRPVYFLDNHDVARFMSWTDERGEERLTAALGFMASLSGPIVLYYGTETGLAGGRPQLGFTDLGRLPMPWNSLNQALANSVSEILRTRSRLPALARGARLPLLADGEVLVMRKAHPEGDVLVGVNISENSRTVRLDTAAAGGAGRRWRAVLGKADSVVAADGQLAWTLPPMSTTWLHAAR